ncbi:leucyl aminopeptidase family protein [Cecembia rubra]|uniref:Leucyl aminopeptidase n=1 Tax=Cecembia rubra TaxID=1485585 RepID=A0A2P8DW84_9BACT|nr:leucyl aminopeptidase family protein [Cecembia rubra]PSL01489.1 leucyl aminopeptidase [Cecembia rubra]
MKTLQASDPSSFKGTVILPFFENENILQARLEFKNIQVPQAIFNGKKDSQYLVKDQESGNIFIFLGLGKNPIYKEIKTAFRRLTAKQADFFQENVLLHLTEEMGEQVLEAAVSGLLLGTYRLGHYKSAIDKEKDWTSISLSISTNLANAEIIVLKAQKLAAAQLETFHLVDLPPNKITPSFLAEWAENAGKQYGFNTKVLDRKRAEKENLHAFLAVGQGSHREPQFIIMEYRPRNAKKHVGLVGKGVTFDTGGLNIKTQGMVHMKCDMGGAATVLGAMQLIADLKIPVSITAVVPCVENSIDNQSILPSEVIRSYSGKTIEIIDTDAEGRLILADGLNYLIKNYKPDTIIDFATLTGSAVGTFGYECAALFSKDDNLLKVLQECGEKVGERVWPLPMWDVYQSEMESEIADIKNYHGKPYAGAITAAKFLEFFTENHPSWAHIDIAGTAFGDSEFAKTKHATAFGVHLLLKFMENL